ncbi:MAG TPA: helix-turn-helix domain-containing protein, partial [Parachlamydiaceae bacterium]|nr:helix-turn-helix domain-containing protein [Parachlamydiaceae bacterium]
MDLKLKDVADLLNVSEMTIRRWLADGKIPAYRINHQYRFSRGEIENWVLNHKLPLSKEEKIVSQNQIEEDDDEAFKPLKGGVKQFSLFRAIHRGGVIGTVVGKTKEEIIRTASKTIADSLGLDSEVISELLLDRENLQPTA